MQMKRDGLYRTSDLYLAVWLLTNRFELEKLCKDDVSEATLRLVHEAKKLVGAKVVSVESKKEQ